MKNVLFICNPVDSAVAERVAKGVDTKIIKMEIVNSKDGLQRFFSKKWDVIFCVAEPKILVDKIGESYHWKDSYEVFKKIEESIKQDQRLYRLGYIDYVKERGGTPYISLHSLSEVIREYI